jgi:type IV secretion system protein VirB4
MTEFIEKDEIRSPIMSFLFHQIVNGLTGKPVIIAIDEAWKALADPEFEKMIKDWARTIRKKNAVLITATQNASDAKKSQALVDQSQTGIYFPNKKAKDKDYKLWGLTQREIYLLRTMPIKRGFFLLKKGDESLIAKLDLTGCDNEIAVLSARTGTVKYMDKLINKHGDRAKDWLPHFYRGWKEHV